MAEVIHTPDLLLAEEIAESSRQVDYPAHVRTFNSVVSVAKWFMIHVAILLVALYFIGFGNAPAAGFLLVGFSIALLVYGLLRRPSIRADVAKAAAASPAADDAVHVDHSPGLGDRTA